MAPVLSRRIPFLDKPLHQKLFGAHKTWRGIVVAALAGMLVFMLQQYFHPLLPSLALIDYADFSPWLGWWMGLGAISGDLVKSYYNPLAFSKASAISLIAPSPPRAPVT